MPGFVDTTFDGLTVNYAYDNDGMLTTAGDFTVARNAANGLPESISDGAVTTSRVFNEYGELANQSTNVAGNDIYSWTLERDANGQITKKMEVLGGATQVYDYLYDDFGRLLEVKLGGTVVESYTYGPNGARISETNTRRGVTGKAYAYSEEDHLLTAGDATYEYDVDGFLTKKTENGQETFYSYSTRGALLRVDLPDGRVIEYVIDASGRRIAKKIDGIIVEKYLWQGLTRLLAVFDGADALKYRFEYGDDRMPVAVEDAGEKKYLVYDQVGSLRAVVDAGGNVLRTAEYDSFGNILSAAGEAFDVFAFAGGLYDADTGLIRFGYRDYDSKVGRWTAKDPIGFAGGDSDLYGYCLGSPINWTDSAGLSGSIADSGTLGISGGRLQWVVSGSIQFESVTLLPCNKKYKCVTVSIGLGLGGFAGVYAGKNYSEVSGDKLDFYDFSLSVSGVGAIGPHGAGGEAGVDPGFSNPRKWNKSSGAIEPMGFGIGVSGNANNKFCWEDDGSSGASRNLNNIPWNRGRKAQPF